MLFLQIVIGLTGNYAFFNLLTIALCLLLIDDAVWPGARPPNERRTDRPALAGLEFRLAVIVLTMPVNAILIFSGFKPEAQWPRPLELVYSAIAPFRIVNSYGLFRVMTKQRPEIIIEGSDDAIEWKAYEFKWKPGALDRMPGFVEPHQPRLDWQMWFAASGRCAPKSVVLCARSALAREFSRGYSIVRQESVSRTNRRVICAPRLYRYRFSTLAEHRRNRRMVAARRLARVSLDGFTARRLSSATPQVVAGIGDPGRSVMVTLVPPGSPIPATHHRSRLQLPPQLE